MKSQADPFAPEPKSAAGPEEGPGFAALRMPHCIVATILFAMFIGIVVMARAYPSDAALFPTVSGMIGAALCAVLIVRSVLSAPYAAGHLADQEHTERDAYAFWVALISPPVYCLILYVAGFHIATFLAMILVPHLLGYQGWLRLTLISAGFLAVMHIVFITAVEIDLPIGLLGDFIMRRFFYID
jgi:hypothetical protein